MAKSNEIVNGLMSMSSQMTFEQIEQASTGVFSTISNSLIVILNVNSLEKCPGSFSANFLFYFWNIRSNLLEKIALFK